MTVVYITQGTVVDLAADRGFTAPGMFEAMVEAQDDLGQATWFALTPNVACGRYADTEFPVEGPKARVAVFDLDNADGMDVIRVTNWVNGHTDEFPELRN